MAAGNNNSLDKTNIIPKAGPGRAGFAVKRSDQRIWSDLDGVQRPVNTDDVKELTGDTTLTAKQSGTKFQLNKASSLTVTLPPPAVGLAFEFFAKSAPGSGSGYFIDPAGTTEKVYAKGITAAAGKGLINTQATAAIGDAVKIWSDGTDWFATLTGTWARES